MEILKEWMSGTRYDYMIVMLAGIAIAYTVLEMFRRVLGTRLRGLASKTDTMWDDLAADMILGARRWFLLVVAAAFVSSWIEVPVRVLSMIRNLAIIGTFLQIGLWGNLIVRHWVLGKSVAGGEAAKSSITGYKVLGVIARIFVWSIVLLLTLDNLGVNVTGLVAGLGVGGVAVALAVQNILGDIFCSITILLDKPFEVGDVINVGDITGEVVQVGIKTTRIRSIQGHEVVMSNADLVGSRISNFRRMNERRVTSLIGVVYGTPPEKLERVPEIIREIVTTEPLARFDRSHFKAYGSFSLDFETVYFVLDRDIKVSMDVQQKVNLEIYRRFAREGIEFAYPTQTLYVNQVPRSSAA